MPLKLAPTREDCKLRIGARVLGTGAYFHQRELWMVITCRIGARVLGPGAYFYWKWKCVRVAL